MAGGRGPSMLTRRQVDWLLPVCPHCHVDASVQTEYPEGEVATVPAAAIRLNASMQSTSFELRET
jgi:hypothetical protein